jgi:hypothetical protein
METIGRYLMLGGVLLLVTGALVFLGAKFGLPLGNLPGDIRITGRNGSFFFPLTTCIVISLLLSGILFLIGQVLKK